MEDKDKLLNKKQATEYLGVGKKFLTSLYKEGRLFPKRNMFGRVFFTKRQLDIYLAETKKR